MQRTINIVISETPNTQAIKFEAEGLLLSRSPFEFTDNNSAERISPLAYVLLSISFVERVFIAGNFITITKNSEELIWVEVQNQLKKVIQDHLESREPIILKEFLDAAKPRKAENELEGAIMGAFEKLVRPATMLDGGDITFDTFEEGVVKVKLAGACVKCPFAPRTIKNGIEKLLKREFPEVLSVTSDDVDWSQTQQEE